MSRVMVFGTFDHFHPGHLDYFRQARRYGEELIAVVARDQNVARFKGRQPQEDEKVRVRRARQILREQGYQGRAVLGGVKNIWLVLNKYKPEVIALGYDQRVDLDKLKSEIARFRFFCQIKRLKPYYPEKYKSSLYKK
jgi:FAD synthetase